jgi:hypothetical protein
MPWNEFSDDCPGCRPALMTLDGKPFPADSPEMVAIDAVWAETSKMERIAWHNVTCKNSRSKLDMELTQPLVKKMQVALAKTGKAKS